MAPRPDPANTEPEIQPIDADPALSEGEARAASFRSAIRAIDRALELAEHERHFAGFSGPGGERDAMQRARMVKLQADVPVPAVVSATSSKLPGAIEKGLAVLAGEVVDTADPVARRKQRLADREILEAAWRAQSLICAERRADLSVDLANRLRAHHNALTVGIFRAAQALARSMDTERALRQRVLLAGYEPRPDITRIPNLSAAAMLGSETVWDSQISTWRRLLQQIQIIE